MHSPTSTTAVREMFNSIAPTYDLLNEILSLGLHRIWENKLTGLLPRNPTGVCLDLCSGTGALLPRLVERYESVVAADISPTMLNLAKKRWQGMPGCEWVEADAQSLPFRDNTFEALSISYGVRNLPNPEVGLAEMLRVAKKGATLGVLEFGQPNNIVWRKVFSFYSRYAIPAIGKLVSGNKEAYSYLPKTSAAFPCGADFESLLTRTGWTPSLTMSLCGGVAFIYLATKT